MDAFERAHKPKKTQKKHKKVRDNIKTELKQMLDGYSKGDNNLIKNTLQINNDESLSNSLSDFDPSQYNELCDEEINSSKIENSLENIQLNETFNSIKINKSMKKSRKATSNEVIQEISDAERGDNNVESVVETHDYNKPKREVKSPSFVSVKTDSLTNEDLNDILGDYRHSTFKNISFESNNTTSPSMFSSQCNHLNVKVQEPIDEVFVKEFSSTEDCAHSEVASVALHNTYSSESREESIKTDLEALDTSFTETLRVYYPRNSCIIVLKHPAELYIHGRVKANVIAGTVEVMGYTLQCGNMYNIFAPNNGNCQFLKTIKNEHDYFGLFHRLRQRGLSIIDTEEIVTTLNEYDCVVELESFKSRKYDFVDDNFAGADLFSRIKKNIEGCLIRASSILGCTLYSTRPWKSFVVNPVWEQIFSLEHSQLRRGLVCGGKGVGKSTFLRYYVNRLLSYGPVLVIDLDPGQCEFTVAGNVSATVVKDPLLGPNFTHLRKPDRMLNIGMINVMDSLKLYTIAITDLINYCNDKEEYRDLPWIVNTMGMCNVVGIKILSFIIQELHPTFVLQIDSKKAAKRFDLHFDGPSLKSIYSQRSKTNKYTIESQCPPYDHVFVLSQQDEDHKSYSKPRDERYLNFLTYFGKLVNMHKFHTFLGIIPYEVPIEQVRIFSNVEFDMTAICHVLNGKIVGLCNSDQPDVSKRPTVLQKKPFECYGHGLIRSIDVVEKLLYILTPVSHDDLSRVNVLVYSDWTPELKCESSLSPGSQIPYCVPSLEDNQDLLRAPRRRFNPLQLLKLKTS